MGVAFVINKEIVSTMSTTTIEIDPGRALLMNIKWHNEQKLSILNIYAPNSPHAHPVFWSNIQSKLESLSLRPEILLGDFNIVEEAIDRAPAHEDYEPAVYCL